MRPLPTLLLACCLAPAARADKEARVYEMRTYHAAPGKLDALHARFRDHTCKLFEKHGMTLIGFWSPLDKKESEEVMVYLLAYPSKDAADKAWKAFLEDPEWLKAKAASEKDGPLVKKVERKYLTPTDYSKLK
jgi:NIPSNAP